MIWVMVYVMCANIIFPATDSRREIVVKKVSSVEVKTGWKLLTDTGIIELPRNTVSFKRLGENEDGFDKLNIRDVFRVGDPVEIKLGYDGQLMEEFKGYITRVSAEIPIEIKLEDEMWFLKQVPVNISLRKTTLDALLKAIVPSKYIIDAFPVELGTVRYSKTTLAQVLDKIKQDYNLYSYMDGNKLVVGKIYSDNQEIIHKIDIDAAPSHSLKYTRADERKILIKAVSTLSNGSKIEATYGDTGGEERQLSYYNIETKTELEKLAKLDFEKYMVDGYEGKIETYGNINIKHGDKIELFSPLYPDRTGIYYVDALVKKYDDSPKWHKELQIGRKAKA